MPVKTIHPKLTAARTSLVLEQPFFGSLILSLTFVEDPTCKTGWIDGRTLGYNRAFIDSLSHEEAIAFLAHEIMHCAMGHPWRRDGREHKRWNVACDKAINEQLRDAGFKTGADWLYPAADESGKSAEWIFGRLPDPHQEQEQEQEQEQDQDP